MLFTLSFYKRGHGASIVQMKSKGTSYPTQHQAKAAAVTALADYPEIYQVSIYGAENMRPVEVIRREPQTK